jgi:glucose-1-phosphate thymidylyltransferase
MMWGIVPAAGVGSRIQPLAFSKELLPVGSRVNDGVERPRAVSEYLVERMLRAGVTRICFVISPGKSDIIEYWGGAVGPAQICYAVQPEPLGLCHAIFCAMPLIPPEEEVVVGLPDTVWFPEDGLCHLGGGLGFLCFPVDRPELFDAVVADEGGRVHEVQVKQPQPRSHWVWGAFKLDGRILRELHALWLTRDPRDPYLGTLVNAWFALGGEAHAVKYGTDYVDTGTLDGYRAAMQLLAARAREDRDDARTALDQAVPYAGRR